MSLPFNFQMTSVGTGLSVLLIVVHRMHTSPPVAEKASSLHMLMFNIDTESVAHVRTTIVLHTYTWLVGKPRIQSSAA